MLFAACKSKQQLVTAPAKLKGATEQIIRQIQANEPQFRTANISKIALNLSVSGKNYNVSANCKMVKDSAIYLSVLMPFLGTEMFRAELTPQNIRLFDKMNNVVYEMDYNFFELQSGLKINFSNIQALLSNTFFTLGCRQPCIADCQRELSQIVFEKSGIKQSVAIDNLFRIVSVNFITTSYNYNFSADYDTFSKVEKTKFSFPYKIKIAAGSPSRQINCVLNISKVEFDTNITLTPLNANVYKKGNIKNLIKMAEGM
ncbi:MAG: DUF4292 domain-containing protein [Paludibacter sp.]|nr:DUF4292 domain-containing protein [Paludibacter sp.]